VGSYLEDGPFEMSISDPSGSQWRDGGHHVPLSRIIYISEERAKAEADRQRELQAQRTQTVDKLKREADAAAKAASTPANEPVPAK
jgi:hypothetical protein